MAIYGANLSERNRFFVYWYHCMIKCVISRRINHLVNSPRLFCSSPFYSRYHITIKTYFYIINIHKCFHNRGGVFHFQIIGDRFVIASISFSTFNTFFQFYPVLFSFIKVYFNTCDNIYFKLASSYKNCSK